MEYPNEGHVLLADVALIFSKRDLKMTKTTKLPDMKAERKKLITHMLESVEAEFSDRGRSNTFIESIREQFDNVGWLSDNQLEALRKFYANAT